MLNWRQVNDRTIEFDHRGQTIYFRYSLPVALPSPAKRALCEWLMLSPWESISTASGGGKIDMSPSEVFLCFSAGVDSTAALQMLGTSPLLYVRREGTGRTMLDQSAHMAFVREMGAHVCSTNFELVRTAYGKGVGYSTGRGMGVPAILASESLHCRGIGYGAVLDDNFYPKGVFRPFTKAYYERREMFRGAGLEIVEPCAGCSEVITTRIVQDGPYADWARSCLRGTLDGGRCGKCYKCYRKGLLTGRVVKWNREAEKMIGKNPPKMAGPLIYGMQKTGTDIEGMEYAKDYDVSWLAQHQPEILEELPPSVALATRAALKRLEVEEMTEDDLMKSQNADFRRPE
jgi:hypothetical protein